MQLTRLVLHNFRCFASLDLAFTHPFIVIEGGNGVGKSSIVEALYFACYLKSFRTHRTQDIARCGDEQSFFLKVHGHQELGEEYTIQAGVDGNEKRIKVNEAAATTYREFLQYYRCIAVSEHDLGIVQGGPEERRAFINQVCLLRNPDFAELLRTHKHIIAQRTQVLQLPASSESDDHLRLWTQQLWENTKLCIEQRQEALATIEKAVADLIQTLPIPVPAITLEYKAKHILPEHLASFDTFWTWYRARHVDQERLQRRTLFGSHLDDIQIGFDGRNARLYASRGQQKLLVLLLKCAAVKLLMANEDAPGRTIMLALDDFITDLDKRVMAAIIEMIQSLGCQILITCPLEQVVTFSKPFQRIQLS